MITTLELSEKCGVSKQSINNYINKHGYRSRLIPGNPAALIPIEIEKEILEYYGKIDKAEYIDITLEEALRKIEILKLENEKLLDEVQKQKEQLEDSRKEFRRLSEEYYKLSDTLQNSAISNAKALLDTLSTDKAKAYIEASEKAQEARIEIDTPDTAPKKKSLFSKIFG